jgi:drug/metabolite transporter (DMT)-like permease
MNKTFRKEIKGIFYAALSGILYGSLGYYGFSLVSEHFTIVDMLFWRFFLASVCLVPFLFRKEIWVSTSFNKIFLLFILGTAVYGVGAGCFFAAAKAIGTGLAMVIFFSFPLFVVLFNWIFDREPVGFITFASIGIILIGLILLADHGSGTLTLSGFMLAILSGLGYAIYVLVGKKVEVTPVLSTFLLCTGSTVLFMLIAFYNRGGLSLPIPSDWFSALMLGVVCTLLPILLLLKAMQIISVTKASVLGVLEPIATVIIGILFLEEMITAQQWLGIAIVLAGALFIQCAPMLRGFQFLKPRTNG